MYIYVISGMFFEPKGNQVLFAEKKSLCQYFDAFFQNKICFFSRWCFEFKKKT